jgi:hypothetical protein
MPHSAELRLKTALAHEPGEPGYRLTKKKTEGRKSHDTVPLKGQCHEIFDLRFFHQTIPLGP